MFFILFVICIAFILYFLLPWFYGRSQRLLLANRAVKGNFLSLTFDDGPGDRLTKVILEMLAEANAKATFFILGKNVKGREEILKQIASQGHEIGSHGYEHINYWKVSPFRAICDIKKGWEVIDNALNVPKNAYPFRPPYGKLNLLTLLYLWIKKTPVYYWTVVSGDTWPENKRDSKRAAILTSQRGGAVVLVHDFDRSSNEVDSMVLDTVKAALETAKQKEMKVATVSELLSMTN